MKGTVLRSILLAAVLLTLGWEVGHGTPVSAATSGGLKILGVCSDGPFQPEQPEQSLEHLRGTLVITLKNTGTSFVKGSVWVKFLQEQKTIYGNLGTGIVLSPGQSTTVSFALVTVFAHQGYTLDVGLGPSPAAVPANTPIDQLFTATAHYDRHSRPFVSTIADCNAELD